MGLCVYGSRTTITFPMKIFMYLASKNVYENHIKKRYHRIYIEKILYGKYLLRYICSFSNMVYICGFNYISIQIFYHHCRLPTINNICIDICIYR